MPQVVRYCDQIAVEENKDALFVDFSDAYFSQPWDDRQDEETDYIKETLMWLDENDIKYELSGPFSNSGWLSGYCPRYYLDIPFDKNDEKYKLVAEKLEYPDEITPKDDRIRFICVLLETAKPIYAESKAQWDDPDWAP